MSRFVGDNREERDKKPARGRTKTFASLSIPAYRRLWMAGLLAFLAVQSQMIARGWLARKLTGTNAGLGAVYLGFGIPMLLATPWGGVAADRMSKRHLMLFSQFLLTASAAWVAVAVAFDFIEYWMLIATAALQAVGFAFMGPARMAFTGELVGREALPNAVVLGQMSLNSTRIIGPALAGILIGTAYVGTAGVYFLSVGLTGFAMFLTLSLPAGSPDPNRQQRSPFAELADGVSYVRQRPEIGLLILTSFAVVMLAFPYVAFLPTLADEIFKTGSTGYGAMSAVSAVGALGASFLIAGRAGGPQASRVQGIAGLAFGATLGLLAVAPWFAVALVVVMLVGGAASAFQSMNNSLVLGLADLEYHGRVQSLMMLSFSGFGLAALPLGLVADAIGIRATLAAMGGVTVAAMGLSILARRRRGFEQALAAG